MNFDNFSSIYYIAFSRGNRAPARVSYMYKSALWVTSHNKSSLIMFIDIMCNESQDSIYKISHKSCFAY